MNVPYLSCQGSAHIQAVAVSEKPWRGPDVNTKYQGTMQINASGWFKKTFSPPSPQALENLSFSFLKTREGSWKSKVCCCKFQFFRSSLYLQRTFHTGSISDGHLNTYTLILASEKLSNAHKIAHLIGQVASWQKVWLLAISPESAFCNKLSIRVSFLTSWLLW